MVKEAKWQVTLGLLARAAAVCYRVRIVLLVLAGTAGVWFGFTVVAADGQSAHSLLALTVLLWALLLLCCGYLLPGIPAAVGPGDGFGARIRKRLLMGCYLLAVLIAIASAVFCAWLSLRALGLSLD